jgi:hypothetical protein
MSFWGGMKAVQETAIAGAAGAAGTFLPPGYAEVGAAGIHGVGAVLNAVEGDFAGAGVEVGSAGAAAIPHAGRVAGVLDMGQAVYNAGVAVDRFAGGDSHTTTEHIEHGIGSLWDAI